MSAFLVKIRSPVSPQPGWAPPLAATLAPLSITGAQTSSCQFSTDVDIYWQCFLFEYSAILLGTLPKPLPVPCFCKLSESPSISASGLTLLDPFAWLARPSSNFDGQCTSTRNCMCLPTSPYLSSTCLWLEQRYLRHPPALVLQRSFPI